MPTERFDTSNEFDSTTNSRFQPTVPGYYLLMGQVSANSTSTALVALYKNGTRYAYGNGLATGTTTRAEGVWLVYLNGSSDYVELFIYTSGTQTGAPAAAGTDNFFCGMLLGAQQSGVPYAVSIGNLGGNQNVTSTSFVDITTQSNVSIAASIGDQVEIEFMCSPVGGGSNAYFVAYSVNASAQLESCYLSAASYGPICYKTRRTIVSADLSGGVATFKMQAKVSAGTMAINNTTSSSTNLVPILTAKNFGDGTGTPAQGGKGYSQMKWVNGALPNPANNGAQFSQVNLFFIDLDRPMLVKGLGAQMNGAGNGTFQWGVFDISVPTAAVKLEAGLNSSGGPLSANPASAPVLVPAGTYALIISIQPAGTNPTHYYTTSLGSTVPKVRFVKNGAYTWVDTIDLTGIIAGGWAGDQYCTNFYLYGYLNDALASLYP